MLTGLVGPLLCIFLLDKMCENQQNENELHVMDDS